MPESPPFPRYTGGLLISNLSSRLLLPLSQGESVVHASDLWHSVSVPTGERWSWVVWFRTSPHCSMAGAADWYRQRAEAGGDAMAMYLHARRMAPPLAGLPRPGDWAARVAAAGWLRASAEIGFVPAAHQLGNAYANGDGVPVDLRVAAGWLARAAGVDPAEWACGGRRAHVGWGCAAAGGAPVGLPVSRNAAHGLSSAEAAGPPLAVAAPSHAGGPSASSRAGVDLARMLLRAAEMGWPSPLGLGACPEVLQKGEGGWTSPLGACAEVGLGAGVEEHAAQGCVQEVEGGGGGGLQQSSRVASVHMCMYGSGAAESADLTAAEAGAGQGRDLALALLRRAADEGHAWAKQKLGEAEAEAAEAGSGSFSGK